MIYLRYDLCYLLGTEIQDHNLIVTKVDTQLRVMNSEGFHVDVLTLNGQHVGLSISQWLPCPLAIWPFALDGNLVQSCSILLNVDNYQFIDIGRIIVRCHISLKGLPPLSRSVIIPIHTACTECMTLPSVQIRQQRYAHFRRATLVILIDT